MPYPPARGYVVAVVSVILAATLRLALDPLLAKNAPLFTFLIAVTAAGYVGGLLPALVATVLGAASGALFLPWGTESSSALVGRILFFGLAGLIVAIVCEQLHRFRREAEARVGALHDSEKRFRVLAESVPSVVWTAAPDGTITWVNHRWYEFCGQTPEQNARGWPERVLHPDDYDRCVAAWTKAIETGSEYEIEVRNRRHDGVYRWFVTRATPQRDASGRIEIWVGVTTDIDDRKRTEDALRDSEERFRTLAQAARCSSGRRAAMGSRSSRTRGGWSTRANSRSARGRGWIEAVHPDDRQPMESVARGLRNRPPLRGGVPACTAPRTAVPPPPRPPMPQRDPSGRGALGRMPRTSKIRSGPRRTARSRPAEGRLPGRSRPRTPQPAGPIRNAAEG